MDGKLGKKYLDNYGKKVKPLLNSYLDSKIRETTKINKYLAELLKHIKKLSLRGKRIRGALTTLGYEAAGGINHKEILKTSLFIELFHTGILIHDDFMDNDDFRRGVETIHKHFEFIGKNPTLCRLRSTVVIPNPSKPSGAGFAVVSFVTYIVSDIITTYIQ